MRCATLELTRVMVWLQYAYDLLMSNRPVAGPHAQLLTPTKPVASPHAQFGEDQADRSTSSDLVQLRANKACNLADFRDPERAGWIRTIFGEGGHVILPMGGQWNSPLAAANSPHGRPVFSPPIVF
jgi:hypothetical protein